MRVAGTHGRGGRCDGRERWRRLGLYVRLSDCWGVAVVHSYGPVGNGIRNEAVVGLSSDVELTFQSWLDLVHPDDRAGIEAGIIAHLEGRTMEIRGQFRHVGPHDAVQWVQTVGRVTSRDSQGAALEVTGFHLDITDRVAARHERQQREELLRTTLDSITDAVVATDSTGCLTVMNPVAEELTGWALEEAAGMHLDDVMKTINAVTREIEPSLVGQVLASGTPIGRGDKDVLIDRSGTEYRITKSAAPILTEDGRQRGVVVVFRDITDEVLFQERVVNAEKIALLGQMVASVAHDFNNRLAAIMGAAELLQIELDADTGSTTARMLDVVLDAARQASDLTDTLLAVGRQGALASDLVDVHETIDSVFAIIEATVGAGVTVNRIFDARGSYVIGDSSALQNCLLNVAVNASHAMPDGGELTIGTSDLDLRDRPEMASQLGLDALDYLQIDILDTGVGIPAENLPRLFEPFFTTKPAGEGSGLGLAAVYGVIHDHGGIVRIESTVGRGTSVHIVLPCYRGLAGNRAEPTAPESWVLRVLVVDDDDVVRTTEALMLESVGHIVDTAADGETAIAIYEREWEHIDVVVLDMVMPGISGADVFAAMRTINPDCLAIVASGFATDESLQDVRLAGLAGFIRKPFALEQFTTLVESAVPLKKGTQNSDREGTSPSAGSSSW